MTGAPLSEALAALATRGRCHNFHALPGAGSGPWTDVSLSGHALDSFFAPAGALAKAQALAAEAFGADSTFLLSCGTSVANRAAFDALASRGPGLLDPMSHQSVFFAARALPVQAHVAPAAGRAGARHVDIEAMLRMLAGCRYGFVALNAASYDGYRLRMADILPRIAEVAPETVVFADEAWSAVHTFSPALARHSTLPAIRDLPLTVVVTQSAHKTLHALRQGSYLHVVGAAELADGLRDAIFRNHTTWPSWPILASLDTARAYAVARGAAAVEESLRLRKSFTRLLGSDPRTVRYLPVPDRVPPFHVADPLKLWLPASAREAPALRRYLFEEHNVYLPRSGPRGLLVHFHIGVSDEDIHALHRALATWCERDHPTPLARPGPAGSSPEIGAVIAEYLLPYPPGVPIARPGDIWIAEHAAELSHADAGGADIRRLQRE